MSILLSVLVTIGSFLLALSIVSLTGKNLQSQLEALAKDGCKISKEITK